MCNINVFIRKKPGTTYKWAGDVIAASAVGFMHNDQAEGIYISGRINGKKKIDGQLFKMSSKLDIYSMADEIDNSDIIMNHQRLATSGKTEQNAHPFESERFVLVHNGVFGNNYQMEEGISDTAFFFSNFCKEFDANRKIGKAIDAALKLSNYGTYSVAILDKITARVYYFKNPSTRISITEGKEFWLITTTSDINSTLIKNETDFIVDNNTLFFFEPKPNGDVGMFYSNEKISSEPPYTYVSTPYVYYGHSYSSDDEGWDGPEWRKKENGEKDDKEKNVVYRDETGKEITAEEAELLSECGTLLGVEIAPYKPKKNKSEKKKIKKINRKLMKKLMRHNQKNKKNNTNKPTLTVNRTAYDKPEPTIHHPQKSIMEVMKGPIRFVTG